MRSNLRPRTAHKNREGQTRRSAGAAWPPLGPDPRPDHAHVALVGAGPGDPELLTVRAWRLLAQADVVLHDALVEPAILALCAPHARLVDVGKRAGGHAMPQDEINRRLVEAAHSGLRIVRLKGGDPFVFGRGGEEALALAEAGFDVEIVPGISSAIAVPASANIPVTHRGVATHFTVVTGHGAEATADLEARWAHLARAGGTLVFLMPTRNLERILATLTAAGMSPERPAALVCNGTRPEQQVLEGTLATLPAVVARHGSAPTPATLVVGEVVRLRHALSLLAGLAQQQQQQHPHHQHADDSSTRT